MWIQDRVAKGEIRIEKIGGKVNIADALTKPVDAKALAVHVNGIGLEARDGRHPEAIEMASDDAIQVVQWNIKGAGDSPQEDEI